MGRGRRIAVVVLAVAFAGALAAQPGFARQRWLPKPTTAPWQWQLQGKIDVSFPAKVYEVDGFETPRRTVAKLHRSGRRAVCYLDVGAWESYRPDADRYPAAVLGRAYSGYPDERWLDIRRIDLLAPVLRRRFDICRRKRFDAVESDNLAGYENRSGFDLTAADQLRFNRWVAREVHRRGMSVALKNDPEQASRLVSDFDFAVVEECFAYDECGKFSPFGRGGQGGLQRRVRGLSLRLLPEGETAPLQHDQEGLRPLRQALAALRVASARWQRSSSEESSSASARSRRSTALTSMCPRASASACSGPTARASRRLCGC